MMITNKGDVKKFDIIIICTGAGGGTLSNNLEPSGKNSFPCNLFKT